MTFPRRSPASDVGYADPDENAQFEDGTLPKRVGKPFPPKKGKRKLALKKKAKRPAPPPRRPMPMPVADDDAGTDY